MFDDVQCDAVRCPLCGQVIDWQSKDGECTMDRVTVHDLMESVSDLTFYGDCPECQVWVEVSVKRTIPRTAAQRAQHEKEKAIIKQGNRK